MQQLCACTFFEAGNRSLVFAFGPLHNHHGAPSIMKTVVTYTTYNRPAKIVKIFFD